MGPEKLNRLPNFKHPHGESLIIVQKFYGKVRFTSLLKAYLHIYYEFYTKLTGNAKILLEY